MTCTELYVITVDCVAKIIRRDVIYLKKRDFFAILAAGVAITVVAQALYKWLLGEPDEDYDCDCADDYEEQEDEAMEVAYDEGFADGINCDYRGCNPAAQVLQAELSGMLDERAACQCGIGDEPEEEAGESEDDKSPEEQQAEQ